MGLDMYIENGQGAELIYWRKANMVHSWFERNVGEVKNLEKLKITKEHLEKLKKDCLTVIEDPEKAKKLLPTRDGFFFGSCDYDEWYFNDLKYTVEKINELFNSSYELDEMYYVAWW